MAGSIMLAAGAALPLSQGFLDNPIQKPIPGPVVTSPEPLFVEDDLDPKTRTDEISAYVLLNAEGKSGELRRIDCASLEPRFIAAEKRGRLSAATYNNWGYSLLCLQRADDAGAKLRRAQELDPDNTTILTNLVGHEFIKCSSTGFVPDVTPFRRLIELSDNLPDCRTMGMGAYSIWKVSERDDSLSPSERDELIAEAKEFAQLAVTAGTSQRMVSMLRGLVAPDKLFEWMDQRPERPPVIPIPVMNPLAQ